MNIGREHFNKVWNKLVAAGYIQTTKTIVTKSKHFEYTHIVHEIPVHQIPVNQEPVNGKLVSLIIDNKNDPEEKPRKNITLSSPRNGVEGGQGQNILDQNNTGPDSIVVQFPSSTDYGKLNEEPEQRIPTEVPKHKNFQGLICESEVPEIELDENDIKNWISVLDEIYVEKFPKWVSMLKNGPFYSFVKSTRIIHQGDKELLSMLSVLYDNIKNENS
jgi:hypothetical protein